MRNSNAKYEKVYIESGESDIFQIHKG